jgi:hypothetical protein
MRNPGVTTDFNPYVFLLLAGRADDEKLALRAAQVVSDFKVAAGEPRLLAFGIGSYVDMSLLNSWPQIRNVRSISSIRRT